MIITNLLLGRGVAETEKNSKEIWILGGLQESQVTRHLTL